MNNIILIGMSGAGKSTLGVLLAKVLNKKFVDTDLLIQTKHKAFLHEIIENEGINLFKRFEEAVLLELGINDTIVATGGSAVYSKAGMEHLCSSGMIVYIRVDYNIIMKRLKNIKARGIVMEEGQSLEAVYLERVKLYERYADLTVQIKEETIEETVDYLTSEILKMQESALAVKDTDNKSMQ